MSFLRRYFWLWMGLLAVTFLTLRLGVIFTAVERISYPDELGAGTIAQELMRGLKMPFAAYQVDFYSQESLFIGLWNRPFFKLLGPTLLALKLAHLVFSCCMVFLSAALLRRWAGDSAALTGACLLTFSSPFITQTSLMAFTAHSEAILPMLLIFWAYGEMMREGNSRLFYLALFGLLSGLGFWFYPAVGVVTAGCMSAWFFTDRRSFLSKDLACFAFFFLSGVSPLLAEYFRAGSQQVFFVEESLAAAEWARVFIKAPRLLLLGFPLSFSSFSTLGLDARVFSVFYALFFYGLLAGLFFRLWKDRAGLRERPMEPALAFYFPVLVFFFMVTRFDVVRFENFFQFRYLTSAAHAGVLAVSCLLPRLRRRKIILAALVALGVLSQSTLLFKAPLASAARYRGYWYGPLGDHLQTSLFPGKKFFPDYGQIVSWFPPDEAPFLYAGMMASWNGPLPSEEERRGQMEALPPALQRQLARKWGNFAVNENADYESLGSIAATLPESARPFFWEGAADDADGVRKWAARASADQMPAVCTVLGRLASGPDPLCRDFSRDFYRGAGQAILCDDCLYQPAFVDGMKTFPSGLAFEVTEEQAQHAAWGLGWAVRSVNWNDSARARDWILTMPEKFREQAAEGAGAYESWYGI